MFQKIGAYLDWIEARGLKYPASYSVVDSGTAESEGLEQELPRLTMYSHTDLSEGDRAMLGRIEALAKKYCSSIEQIERNDANSLEKLRIASERGDKIVLFQLNSEDVVKSAPTAATNVVVTGTAALIQSNPSIKRLFWNQLQILLGITEHHV